MYFSDKLFQRSREGYFLFISWVAKGNKHKNNTQVSAETVRHQSTYIIYFLHDIMNP